jgi:hypothetical protein
VEFNLHSSKAVENNMQHFYLMSAYSPCVPQLFLGFVFVFLLFSFLAVAGTELIWHAKWLVRNIFSTIHTNVSFL